MVGATLGSPQLSSFNDKLLRFGVLLESISPFPNDDMITVVDKITAPGFNQTALLNNKEITAIESSLPVPPVFIVALLKNFLSDVPHGNSAEIPIVVHLVLTSIAGICVLLRLYSRKRIVNMIKPEDWAITVSLVLTIIFAFTMWAAILKGGASYHIYDISFNTLKMNMKFVYFAELLYQISLLAVRSSVLLLYWGLTIDPSFRRPVWVVGVLNIVLFIIRISFAIFQCKPIAFWNSPLHKKCIGQNPTWYILWGSFSVALDLTCVALPIPIVWKLNMSKRERLMVIGVFLIGTIATVGSVARLFFVKPFLQSVDAPFAESPMAIWSLVELDLGIIASCAPAIKALIVKHAPGFFGHFTRKGSSSHHTARSRGEQPPPQNAAPLPVPADQAYDTAISNSSTLYNEEDANRWETHELEQYKSKEAPLHAAAPDGIRPAKMETHETEQSRSKEASASAAVLPGRIGTVEGEPL